MSRDPLFAGVVVLLWLLFGLFVLYPMAALFGHAFVEDGALVLAQLLEVIGNEHHRQAFLNSLIPALAVGIGGTLLGFLFAFTAACGGLSRRAIGLFDTATLLPLISPPFTISVAILFSFRARGLITYDLLAHGRSHLRTRLHRRGKAPAFDLV